MNRSSRKNVPAEEVLRLVPALLRCPKANEDSGFKDEGKSRVHRID